MKTYLFVAGVMMFALAACSAAPGESVSIVEVTPTVEAPPPQPAEVQQPTAQPPVTAVGYTGLAGVDSIIEAVLAHDAGATRPFIQFVTVGCTNAEGLGGPPKCAEGQAEGTLVDVFPLGGPEGTFATPETISDLLPLNIGDLHAVYSVPDDAYNEEYWPRGEYGIVFTAEEPVTLIVLVGGDNIVRIDFVYGATAEEATSQRAGEVIYQATP